MKTLYEILVPVTREGKKIKKRIHREWDHRVSEIAGGLTLFKAKKGRWLCQGTMYREKMIRVRIAAKVEEIEKVLELTKSFYKQEAIMCHVVSEKALLYDGRAIVLEEFLKRDV